MLKKMLALSLVLAISGIATADTVTLSATDIASGNSYQGGYTAGLVYTNYSDFSAGSNYNVPTHWISWLDFDAAASSGIDSSATVNSATLRLYLNNKWGTNCTDVSLLVSRITEEWIISTDGEALDPFATGNVGVATPDGVNSWANGTVWGSMADFVDTPVLTATGQWYEVNVTDIVSQWVGNAASAGDYGFGLSASTYGANSWLTWFYCFNSASNSPELVIDYTVPEPATMTLLGLGAMAALRRRRK